MNKNWIIYPLVIIVTIFSTLYVTYMFETRRMAVSVNKSEASDSWWDVYSEGKTSSYTDETGYHMTTEVTVRTFTDWFNELFIKDFNSSRTYDQDESGKDDQEAPYAQ